MLLGRQCEQICIFARLLSTHLVDEQDTTYFVIPHDGICYTCLIRGARAELRARNHEFRDSQRGREFVRT